MYKTGKIVRLYKNDEVIQSNIVLNFEFGTFYNFWYKLYIFIVFVHIGLFRA